MGKRTGKVNGAKQPWKARVQATRHASAQERQKIYDALTPQQKLAKLDKYDWTATRERARINALIEKQKEVKVTPKPAKKESK